MIIFTNRLFNFILFKPCGQNRQKTVCRSAFFVNSVLKIQSHVVKNTLLHTAFSGDFAH